MRDTIHNIVSHNDSAYIFPYDTNKIGKTIPVDAYGKCHIAELVAAKSDEDDEHHDQQPQANNKPEKQMLKWLCVSF